MSALDDDLLLSELSIPGTHDTGTWTGEGGDLAQTQSMRLWDQLHAGIRALDIRLRLDHCKDNDQRFHFECDPDPHQMRVYHGFVNQDLDFSQDILQEAIFFLDQNPGETILMRIRNELIGDEKVQQTDFDSELKQELQPWIDRIYNSSDDPTLGEIRGKIVILQNFGSTQTGFDFGIPYPTHEDFNQDKFEFEARNDKGAAWDLGRKWKFIKEHFVRTENGDPKKLYINFLSGSDSGIAVFPYFVVSGHTEPRTDAPDNRRTEWERGGAPAKPFDCDEDDRCIPEFPCLQVGVSCHVFFEGTNILAKDYIRNNVKKRAGIVYTDFPGAGLIGAIIDVNKPDIDLSIDVTDSPDPVAAGSDLTYTLAVTNNDPKRTAEQVVVRDELPAGTTFNTTITSGVLCTHSPTPSNQVSSGMVTCPIRALPPGATETISIHVEVEPGPEGALSNRAMVGSSGFFDDLDPVNNFDLDTTEVINPPNADVDGPYTIDEGDTVALDGSNSSDPGGQPLTYSWDLDSDGTFGDATGDVAHLDVPQDGTFSVTLMVTDPDGHTDSDTTTVTALPVAPIVADLSTDAPIDEGSPVTVSGTISDQGWLDALSNSTISWQDGTTESLVGPIANDMPTARLSFDATHVYGDQSEDPASEAVYGVEVCPRDEDFLAGICRPIDVLVRNVAPKVEVVPDQETVLDEGDVLDVRASFSDPGWLDTYTGAIEWGTPAEDMTDPAALVVTTSGPPGDLGEVSGSFQYGDNGTFVVAASVTDDDSGLGRDNFTLTVNNVDPTAVIDLTASLPINAVQTFIADAGDTIDFSANSWDPGSDDLFATWDWGDGTTTGPTPYLLNPLLFDPPHSTDPAFSPEVGPRNITDDQSHIFGDACAYETVFTSEDDDAGSEEDAVDVIITGVADQRRAAGYWHTQYKHKNSFTDEELLCFLQIAGFMSTVFDEKAASSTITDAKDVLKSVPSSNMAAQLDRALLTAWLNFGNGSIELETLVDTDENGFGDITFADALATAEAVRTDSAPTRAQLEAQKALIERINEGRA